MGAELILATAVIPVGVEPDWAGAEAWVEGLDPDELAEVSDRVVPWVGEPGGDEAVRVWLRGLLVELRQLLGESHREVDVLVVAGNRVFVAGGLSWGDDPTGAFTVLNDAGEAGLLRAAGFVEAEEAPARGRGVAGQDRPRSEPRSES